MSSNAFNQIVRDEMDAEDAREIARDERAESIRRANACVRACNGFSTEFLEQASETMADPLRSLILLSERHTNELIALMKAVKGALKNTYPGRSEKSYGQMIEELICKIESEL